MTRLRIAPIVEGHGEVDSIRILLRRLCEVIKGCDFIDVLQPIRVPKARIVGDEAELQRALNLATLKLQAAKPPADRLFILILIDADKDPPCVLGPRLLTAAQRIRSDIDISCVLANVEYETWLVAAAESLQAFLKPSFRDHIPNNPERERAGKGWVQEFMNTPYAETVDQPRLTAAIDPIQCRSRSDSFDKLFRELERRVS